MKAEVLDTQRQIDSRAADDDGPATCRTAP